jgi:flagellar hook-associated protein 3 FlgL
MGVRITPQILIDTVLADIRGAHGRLAQTQRMLATGRRINTPSDDPVGTTRAMNLRTNITNADQYLQNIREATTFASESEAVLRSVIEHYHRARELTVRGATGTLDQQQRDAIALEINQILEAIVDLANTESNGRYLFSGTRTRVAPYVPNIVAGEITWAAYAGNSERFGTLVSPGVTLEMNEPGNAVFMNQPFQTLARIRDDLRAGDTDSLSNVRIGEIDDVMTALLDATALFGARMNRLDLIGQRLEEQSLTFRARLSETEEADFLETAVRLEAQEVALQAALNAGARVLQPSLLDFIA